MKYPTIVTLHYGHDTPLIRGTVGPFKNTRKAEEWCLKNCHNQVWQVSHMAKPKSKTTKAWLNSGRAR